MTRNTFKGISALLALTFVWTGCTQYTEYESGSAGRVETLLYPSDGFEIDLINNDNASLTFEWEASESGNPLYEVIIYGSDGVTEAGRFESDNNGADNMLNLPHKTVIELADMAGITPESTGDLYWTAVAVNGTDVQTDPPAPNKFTVTRDAAVVGAPSELYITGEGTEAGADIVSALPLRSTGDGTYEIFASLDGGFSLVNRNSEGLRRAFYATSGSKLTENPDEAASFEEGVYRIRVDFNNNAVTCEKVNSLKLNFADGSLFSDMEYSGRGIWKTQFIEIRRSSGNDDRYRFVADVDGHQELWSSDREDRDASAPGTLNSADLYFRVYEKADAGLLGDSYQGCYKFYPAVIGRTSSVVMDMSGDIYRHYFTFEFTSEAPEVQTLIAPEDGASVELSIEEGASQNFSWEEPVLEGVEAGKLPLTNYSVVFFSDAQGSTRLASYSASGTSVSVTHLDLETVATDAGIAAGETGTVYWGVESEMISYTALSRLNSLNVTRMKGVPDQLYITGEATEFGSGFGQFKKLDIGEFEIYTRLSSGSYAFTDGTEGDIRRYVIEGNSVKESETDGSWTAGESIYRITLNLREQVPTAKVERISDVYMQSCVDKGTHITLDYVGNGIWYKENVVPDFRKDFDDTRFFVKMNIDGKEWKLANQQNFGDSDPTNAAPERSPEYAVKFWDDNSDWDYHYKVIQSYRGQNTKALNIKLNCSPQEEFYYVYLEYLD